MARMGRVRDRRMEAPKSAAWNGGDGGILRAVRWAGHLMSCCFVVAVGVLASRCASPRQEFTGARILQTCDQAWPSCDVVAGCLLGGQSYTQGRFPGDNR